MPLLDDHLVHVSRRRMVRELCGDAGMTVTDDEVVILSGTRRSPLLGCVIGALIGMTVRVIVKIVRRFFRSILFFLTVRDAANAASRTFHEGYLLAAALDFGELSRLPGNGADRDVAVQTVRERIEEVVRAASTSPIRNTIRLTLTTGWRLVRAAASGLRAKLRGSRHDESDEAARLVEESPQPIVEHLTLRLWRQNRDLLQLAEMMRPASAEQRTATS